jgi:preprotein translocase subunit SecE
VPCSYPLEPEKESINVAKTKERVSAARRAPDKRTAQGSNPIARYLRETRGELRKVTWPTRQESWRLTTIVLGVSIVMAVFLWLFDTGFSNSIRFLLEQIIGL